MLQWTLGCVYPFGSCFSPDTCPGMGSWGQTVALVLVLKGNSGMCRGRCRGGYPIWTLCCLGAGGAGSRCCCNKLPRVRGLKQHKLSIWSWRQTEWKSWREQSRFLWRFGREPFSCLSQLPGAPASLAQGPLPLSLKPTPLSQVLPIQPLTWFFPLLQTFVIRLSPPDNPG